MDDQRGVGRPSRYPKRFHFFLTNDQFEALHTIAGLANDDAAEVLRRMLEREAPFFMYFASVNKRLPSVSDKATP